MNEFLSSHGDRKGNAEATTVTIADGTDFDSNRAEHGDGGAVSVQGEVRLQVNGGVRFLRNSAAGQGGAIFVVGASNVMIDSAVFIENASNFSGGGAIFAEVCVLSLCGERVRLVASRTRQGHRC